MVGNPALPPVPRTFVALACNTFGYVYYLNTGSMPPTAYTVVGGMDIASDVGHSIPTYNLFMPACL